MGLVLLAGQTQSGFEAALGTVAERELGIVEQGHVAGNGQAQACAAQGLVALRIQAEEGLEDRIEQGFREARALIQNADCATGMVSGQDHPGAASVLAGIGNEIFQAALEAEPAHPHDDWRQVAVFCLGMLTRVPVSALSSTMLRTKEVSSMRVGASSVSRLRVRSRLWLMRQEMSSILFCRTSMSSLNSMALRERRTSCSSMRCLAPEL